MARVPHLIQIPFIVDTLAEVEFKNEAKGGAKEKFSFAQPVNKAVITVFNREKEEPAAIYATEKGESILSPVETNAKGEIPGWVEEAPLRITAKEGTPSIAEKSFNWDSVSGRGVEHISEYAGTSETGASKTVKEKEIEEKVI